jgi:hypothetical protein
LDNQKPGFLAGLLRRAESGYKLVMRERCRRIMIAVKTTIEKASKIKMLPSELSIAVRAERRLIAVGGPGVNSKNPNKEDPIK